MRALFIVFLSFISLSITNALEPIQAPIIRYVKSKAAFVVTATSPISSGVIYYTIKNSSNPVDIYPTEASYKYIEPVRITVSGDNTLKFVVYAEGYLPSSVTEWSKYVKVSPKVVSTPAYSLGNGIHFPNGNNDLKYICSFSTDSCDYGQDECHEFVLNYNSVYTICAKTEGEDEETLDSEWVYLSFSADDWSEKEISTTNQTLVLTCTFTLLVIGFFICFIRLFGKKSEVVPGMSTGNSHATSTLQTTGNGYNYGTSRRKYNNSRPRTRTKDSNSYSNGTITDQTPGDNFASIRRPPKRRMASKKKLSEDHRPNKIYTHSTASPHDSPVSMNQSLHERTKTNFVPNYSSPTALTEQKQKLDQYQHRLRTRTRSPMVPARSLVAMLSGTNSRLLPPLASKGSWSSLSQKSSFVTQFSGAS
eukprot:TRINITY_DN970_c0_g2_i1.p1 TRINITY_DN970_c0_g2~~TRINITY_DN970_c0_g2_i1.p1  ORF type:complete len:420 (-),score=52.96 TRINITY_DN970_c0_g2_i1:1176-2435(-)